MTAKLLSFTQTRGGWGNVEMAQFARIQRLLENVGLHIDVEHGITDEGDPWCVFCSNTTGDVVIHAARIGGVYMFDSPVLQTPIEGRSFQHCAEKFLDEAMQAIPVVRRRSTLQVHPSALLASVFLTIVLHAQATSEHSPFRVGDSHGDPFADLDPAAKNAGWLKLIAQHLAELFGPQDPSSTHQNQQLQNWVSVIPVGLTVSVLGIVHELVTRDDRLMLIFDNVSLEGTAGNAEHDSHLAAVEPEGPQPDTAAAAQDASVVTMVADAASEDTIEVKTAEAHTNEQAPSVVVEQGLPTSYLALAHAFVEEVVAFASDTVTALASAAATATAQADNADNGASLDVAQTDSQQPATAVSTIAAATIALLKPLVDASDTIEFISLPEDANATVLLAAYNTANRPGSADTPATVDVGSSDSVNVPVIEVAPPPATAEAPAAPTTSTGDVITQLDWLIEVADNVVVHQSGGNYIIVDKDAMFIDQGDRFIETFVMEDHSEITFIGVAADFDGLFA
ncbi:MAG: hypothetical protein JNL61_09315 [Rhizobiaceae bacterium]|nr:hypothetical protein [Rhizobiaceae bacterium]